MSDRTTRTQDVFLPGLMAADETGGYWLRQAMWRLRREIAWLWHERGWAGQDPPVGVPPAGERVVTALDLGRYAEQKRLFFETDVAAAFLSGLISEPAPAPAEMPRGSFGWLAQTLALSDVECFALALALMPVVDSASGSVIAACLNDSNRTQPSLALVQRLWDRPEEALELLDPAHTLMRHGLLHGTTGTWEAPLSIPGALARLLLWGAARKLAGKEPPPSTADICDPLAAARLRASAARAGARLMPLIARRGTCLKDAATALARSAGQPLLAPVLMPGQSPATAATAATEAWLRGALLYLPVESLGSPGQNDTPLSWPLPELPLTVLVGMHDHAQLGRLPESLRIAETRLPAMGYEERLELWQRLLPEFAGDPVLAELARRFRFGPERIGGICREVRQMHDTPGERSLIAACRAEIDLGSLAQPVTPRFRRGDLKLPPKQAALVDGLVHAMRQLTTVHYQWGTARPWNEAGLSALFAGPPGTGKTMAAEVVAAELDLPLYRIDLSQVVNKYIGETEKNLSRLFDTAEDSDVVLFFDEADAIFGKRSEVRDSHDRYANLEISYLLERMERFKGLAILATNRRKDLDEAFMRRLRWVVEFELPGPEERLALWQQCLPDVARVDCHALDLALLAQRFALSGGHIRSIMLNACLRACRQGQPAVLTMPDVLHAVRHEYDKLGRTVDPALFMFQPPD